MWALGFQLTSFCDTQGSLDNFRMGQTVVYTYVADDLGH